MTIGQRIRQRREELNMTQEELAHKIGYKSKSSINKIEIDVQQLKQSKIKEIAEALQTTPDYIMGWTQEVKTKIKPLTVPGSERRHEDDDRAGARSKKGVGRRIRSKGNIIFVKF